MNEFDYDVRRRANLARQSRHKKNGSKSKKCPLSTDRMTVKQWKERNGPVISMNMNEPMIWKEFKSLPGDLKKEYIDNLISKYGATSGAIAEMLGVTPSFFSKYLSNGDFGITFNRYAKRSAEKKKLWAEFLNPVKSGNVEVVDEVMDTVVIAAPASECVEINCNAPEEDSTNTDVANNAAVEDFEPVCENVIPENDRPAKMAMEHFTIGFSGLLNADMIANSLRSILGNKSCGTITINCMIDNG